MSQPITRDEVARHNSATDCWIIVGNGVYAFPVEFILQMHPGGPVLLEAAGKNGTELFEDGGHGDGPRSALENFRVGTLRN